MESLQTSTFSPTRKTSTSKTFQLIKTLRTKVFVSEKFLRWWNLGEWKFFLRGEVGRMGSSCERKSLCRQSSTDEEVSVSDKRKDFCVSANYSGRKSFVKWRVNSLPKFDFLRHEKFDADKVLRMESFVGSWTNISRQLQLFSDTKFSHV